MNAPMPMVTFFKTVDVTRLARISKRTGLKFNMLMCWCIGRAANRVKEFYLLPVGRKLMQYDRLAVCTIVANREGEVSSCDVPFSTDLKQFNEDYLRLTKQVAHTCCNHDLPDHIVIGTSALAHFAKAVEYYLLQDAEKASAELDSAVNADKTFMLAYFARAVVHAKMADMAEQGARNEKGITAALPEKADIHLMMAKADMNKVVELSPDLPYAYYNRACIEAKTADYESAEADLTKCIQLYDKFAEAYYNRGIIRILGKNTKEGLNDLSKAGELGLYQAYGLIKKYAKDN